MDKFSLGYPEVPFSITNKTVSKNNAEDISMPFSLLEFIKRVASVAETNNITGFYNYYLTKWNSLNKQKQLTNDQEIVETYRNFLKDISLNFTSEAEKQFLSQIDYNDKYDLDVALSFIARKIKEIALYYSKKREDIKLEVYRNKFSGSTKGLATTIKEKIIDVLSNTLNKKQGYDIASISKQINVKVDELYSDETRIYNKTPDEKNYEAKDLDYGLDIFLRSNQDLVKQVFSPTTSTFQSLNEADSIFNKKRELTKKYIGSDYYYISATPIAGQGVNVVYNSTYNILYNREKINVPPPTITTIEVIGTTPTPEETTIPPIITPEPPPITCKCFSVINYATTASKIDSVQTSQFEFTQLRYTSYNLLSSQSVFSYIDCDTKKIRNVKMPYVDQNTLDLLNADIRNAARAITSGVQPVPVSELENLATAQAKLRNYNANIGGYIFTGCAYNGAISGANYPETITISNIDCKVEDDCKIEITTPPPPPLQFKPPTVFPKKPAGGGGGGPQGGGGGGGEPKPPGDQEDCCTDSDIIVDGEGKFELDIPDEFLDKGPKNNTCVRIDKIRKSNKKIKAENPLNIRWAPERCCDNTHYKVFYLGWEVNGKNINPKDKTTERTEIFKISIIGQNEVDSEGNKGKPCGKYPLILPSDRPEFDLNGCDIGSITHIFEIEVYKMRRRCRDGLKDCYWNIEPLPFRTCRNKVSLPGKLDCCNSECGACFTVGGREGSSAVANPDLTKVEIVSDKGNLNDGTTCYKAPVKAKVTITVRRETSCYEQDDSFTYTIFEKGKEGSATPKEGTSTGNLAGYQLVYETEGACGETKTLAIRITITSQDGKVKNCDFFEYLTLPEPCCPDTIYVPESECPPCDTIADPAPVTPPYKPEDNSQTNVGGGAGGTGGGGGAGGGGGGGGGGTEGGSTQPAEPPPTGEQNLLPTLIIGSTSDTTTCDPCPQGSQNYPRKGKSSNFKVSASNSASNNNIAGNQQPLEPVVVILTTPSPSQNPQ